MTPTKTTDTDPVETVPLGSLLLDFSLYPRHHLNAVNLGTIQEALQAGKTMPPLVADRKSKALVDGFHRATAYEHLYGPDHPTPVILKEYRNRAAMLEEAIALNVGRGSDLSRWDLPRCMALAEQEGLPFKRLADLLQWKEDRLAAYGETRMARTEDMRRLALKRTIKHMTGQTLTPAQAEANQRLSGMPARFHANQLVLLLSTDLMPETPDLTETLLELADLIHTHYQKEN